MFAAQFGVTGQLLMGGPLVLRVVNLKWDDDSLGESGRAVGVGAELVAQLGLQPADEHAGERVGPGSTPRAKRCGSSNSSRAVNDSV